MGKQQRRIPMYVQIKDYMLDHIHNATWRPNDKIPSENELSEQFNVSRITVKKALAELMELGLVYRIQGKGSFVSPEPNSGEPPLYRPVDTPSPLKLAAYLIPRLENQHSMQLLNGVESELSKQGYRMLLCKTHDSREIERETLSEMIRMGVKGIIVFPVDGETYSEEILRLTMNQFPLIVVDRYFRGIDTNCVCSDNIEGAHMATTHLIELGHRNIGIVSTAYQGTTSIEDRITGYERALADKQIPIDHRLRLMHFSAEEMNTVLKEGSIHPQVKEDIQLFLQNNRGMSAVFAINASVGLAVIEAATDLGIRVPEDLSVVFFDNYELSTFSRVPPTCVSQQELELGRAAARLLVSVIENPSQERKKIVITPKLIVRSSTAPYIQEQVPSAAAPGQAGN